ncbi:hypothetical protein CCACVL1_02206, partial [Corchorus capsularis]
KGEEPNESMIVKGIETITDKTKVKAEDNDIQASLDYAFTT